MVEQHSIALHAISVTARVYGVCESNGFLVYGINGVNENLCCLMFMRLRIYGVQKYLYCVCESL